MKVLIVGAAGMIGRKLAARLAADGRLAGRPLSGLTLFDVVEGAPLDDAGGIDVAWTTGDIVAPETARALMAGRPDIVFHLAAVVSGQAEADLELGYRVNLMGTQSLFDAIRAEAARKPYRPRVVLSSSLAVYGPPFPAVIEDDFERAPSTSYGTQKAMGELLLADYSRRGVLDGIAIRLPTICIRPGLPNAAASGFFSSILREPLAGREAVLPVDEDVRHWFASPRAAIGFLVHAAEIDLSGLGARRALMMPGLSATVGEQLDALAAVAGAGALRLVKRLPDAAIADIVESWPSDFAPRLAVALSFTAERTFEDIIRVHLEDEMGAGRPAGRTLAGAVS